MEIIGKLCDNKSLDLISDWQVGGSCSNLRICIGIDTTWKSFIMGKFRDNL